MSACGILQGDQELAEALQIKNHIVQNIHDNMFQYGNITEKQVALVHKIAERHRKWEKEREESGIAKSDVIEGKQTITGTILEGGAQQNRQILESISRQAAQGGSARNTATSRALAQQAQIQVHQSNQQALWQSNLALMQFSQDNLRKQLAFNQAWVDGAMGQDFMQNFMNLAGVYTSSIMPAEMAKAEMTYNSGAVLANMKMAQKNTGQIIGQAISGVGDILAGAGVSMLGGGGGATTRTANVNYSPNTQFSWQQ